MERYKVNVSVYLKSGGVYSTTLESGTIENLNQKKKEFLEKEKVNSEVITFGSVIKITTELMQHTDESHYFVEETTNEYLMSLARPLTN